MERLPHFHHRDAKYHCVLHGYAIRVPEVDCRVYVCVKNPQTDLGLRNGIPQPDCNERITGDSDASMSNAD